MYRIYIINNLWMIRYLYINHVSYLSYTCYGTISFISIYRSIICINQSINQSIAILPLSIDCLEYSNNLFSATVMLRMKYSKDCHCIG